MSFNDPIAECLTKIRNAAQAKHRYVDLRLSKAKLSIIEILKKQGFIENFLTDKEQQKLRIFLKFKARRSLFHGLKRISKPGLRKYVQHADIPTVANGMGFAILSTSRGVMDSESAKKKGVGGEIWCYIW
jgi:small subunit ribosomal protein S8